MNKNIGLIFVLALGACANCHKKPAQPEPQPAPVVYEEPLECNEVVAEVNPCACALGHEPYREVQHPRIVEQVMMPEPKRHCDDHQFLNCGCGQCDTFHQAPQMEERFEQNPMTYVPAQPQSYVLASNRAFNRFIKDTYDIYSKKPDIKVYVKDGVLKNGDLPQGIDKGVESFKTNLANSHTFRLTDDEKTADYVLTTTAEWFDTPSKDVPAIKYIIRLTDKNGEKAGVWSQIVTRADNKSWL